MEQEAMAACRRPALCNDQESSNFIIAKEKAWKRPRTAKPNVWPISTHHLILSNVDSESDAQSYILFTRVAWITWVDLWLLISLDSCLCCEDVIKSKLVYTVLMRPKIRPKHVPAVTQCHVKNHLFMFSLTTEVYPDYVDDTFEG